MAHPPLPGHYLLRRLPPSPEQLPTTTSIFPYSSPFNNHQQTTYDLHSKIMLTAIISLSVVVFVVTALHIYARVFLRRQSRARAALRSFRLAADVHSLDPPTSGLDPAVIASLPIFVYKTTAGAAMDGGADGGEEAAGDECAVCLSVLEDEEMARSLPNCKHVFHAECIDKWLSSHSNCPICRTEAEPRVQPVVREGPAASAEGSSSQKGGGSGSGSRRLSSIRRMLSRERSSRRIQAEIIEDCLQDLERQ